MSPVILVGELQLQLLKPITYNVFTGNVDAH